MKEAILKFEYQTMIVFPDNWVTGFTNEQLVDAIDSISGRFPERPDKARPDKRRSQETADKCGVLRLHGVCFSLILVVFVSGNGNC